MIARKVAFFWIGAWAQVTPEAAQLLERARNVLGGPALANLKTYREVTTHIYYLPDGKEESRIVTLLLVDFAKGRVRLELYDPESVSSPSPIPLALQQYSPQESFFWSRETSLRPLPQGQREILRSSLYTGWLGLKYGSSNRERARVTQGSLRNQTGRLLTVSTQGWVSTYLFNTDGLLLGERLNIPGIGESITFFCDNSSDWKSKASRESRIYPWVHGLCPSRQGIVPRVNSRRSVPKGIVPRVNSRRSVPKGIVPARRLRPSPENLDSPVHGHPPVPKGIVLRLCHGCSFGVLPTGLPGGTPYSKFQGAWRTLSPRGLYLHAAHSAMCAFRARGGVLASPRRGDPV